MLDKDCPRFRMTSRRMGYFLLLLGFVWGITLINMTISNSAPRDSEMLKEEILQMSEKYVRSMAKETQNAIDGPYAGRLTGYDLKKTMAVLLENMLDRLDRLEHRVDDALKNGSLGGASLVEQTRQIEDLRQQIDKKLMETMERGNPEAEAKRAMTLPPGVKPIIDMKGLILGEQENCELSDEVSKVYPHCRGKVAWMKSHWKSDACYATYGVDGTECSFRVYLSEVEHWCPLLPGRKALIINQTSSKVKKEEAVLNFDLEGLMSKLTDPGQHHNYEWIRMRIGRMWAGWISMAKKLSAEQSLAGHSRKRVLVHLGLLSQKAGFKIAENSLKGGPLGELVQWSDIISSLYILGHDLVITSEVEQLTQILVQFPSAEAQCQIRDKVPVDMIFSDIVGLTQFKKKVKNGYGKFSCLLRVIDSFGTEPAFNYEPYAKAHKMKTTWGMQNIHPQQFYTMFPHSPDNSFMGFVIENHLNETEKMPEKKNNAVVYGKAESMWQGKDTYLSIVKEFADIHGTVFVDNPDNSILPGFIENHGIMPGPELHRLLRESKLFIGLGFPYEGPAPLEAIAQGCVYINPRFTPPHNSQNTKFFKGKPTLRKVTSQHPYAEEFIGEPHVFTVDINEKDELRSVIKRALELISSNEVQPFMPYEYTEGGMLQRLHAYVEHQDFCSSSLPEWPPESSISLIEAERGRSCKEACRSKHLICEPSYFKSLNSIPSMESVLGMKCGTTSTLDDIYYPAYHSVTRDCVLQGQILLFSCVGEQPDLTRLCPCRDFIPGQTALCKTCT